MDYRILWRKRDGRATLSRGEHLDPCLDRLLLLFWAHYIDESPHYLVLIYYAQVRFRWLHFTENKGENVANYFKEKKVCKSRGKVVELVTLPTWEV